MQFIFQIAVCSLSLLANISYSASLNSAPEESSIKWYQQGEKAIQKARLSAKEAAKNSDASAKNIILFVGDGMGISTITAARIYAGQMQGKPGEENILFFEKFPYLALAKTYNTNQQTPDSAGTMTAMMTGMKTKAGIIGVGQ
ncbi:alkaline phosphatase, partial [Methylococcaceae bacterium CS2]